MKSFIGELKENRGNGFSALETYFIGLIFFFGVWEGREDNLFDLVKSSLVEGLSIYRMFRESSSIGEIWVQRSTYPLKKNF